MKKRDTHEVVKAIIGDVHPVGETHTDNERYSNLKDMIDLTGELMGEIWEISRKALEEIREALNQCDRNDAENEALHIANRALIPSEANDGGES